MLFTYETNIREHRKLITFLINPTKQRSEKAKDEKDFSFMSYTQDKK